MNKSYGRAKVILIIIQFLVMVGFGIVIPIMLFLSVNWVEERLF